MLHLLRAVPVYADDPAAPTEYALVPQPGLGRPVLHGSLRAISWLGAFDSSAQADDFVLDLDARLRGANALLPPGPGAGGRAVRTSSREYEGAHVVLIYMMAAAGDEEDELGEPGYLDLRRSRPPSPEQPRRPAVTQIVNRTPDSLVTAQHFLVFGREGSGSAFPCDPQGVPDAGALAGSDTLRGALEGCVAAGLPSQVILHTRVEALCRCGSGLARRPLHDARGIFAAYVCDACEERTRAGYRADVFSDPSYETGEDVDG